MECNTGFAARLLSLLLAGLALIAPLAFAQDASRYKEDRDVSVKINGDLVQQAGEENGVVVVVRGSARIEGSVEVLVVVDGTAELIDARIGELTVVQGEASLRGATRIDGDVRLFNATMQRSEDVEIMGEVLEDSDAGWGPGAAIFGALFGIGFMFAVLLAGVFLAVLAPHTVRRVGLAITDEAGKTIGAGLVLWIVLPIAAGVMMVTVIGMPAAIGFFVFLMPVLAFTGYLIAGIRTGDLLMERLFGTVEFERPIQATLLGLIALLILGWVPIVGFLVTPIATFMGTGAVALAIWRVFSRKETWRQEESAAM